MKQYAKFTSNKKIERDRRLRGNRRNLIFLNIPNPNNKFCLSFLFLHFSPDLALVCIIMMIDPDLHKVVQLREAKSVVTNSANMDDRAADHCYKLVNGNVFLLGPVSRGSIIQHYTCDIKIPSLT